jgi:hypothetical protein
MQQKPVRTIRNKEKKLVHKVHKNREAAFQRFPLLFTMLGTFGVVATFYGFEGIIDRIDVLADNPWLILASGVCVLAATGTLYNRLR